MVNDTVVGLSLQKFNSHCGDSGPVVATFCESVPASTPRASLSTAVRHASVQSCQPQELAVCDIIDAAARGEAPPSAEGAVGRAREGAVWKARERVVGRAREGAVWKAREGVVGRAREGAVWKAREGAVGRA